MSYYLPSFEIPTPFIPSNFSPWFITGHADAEACFNIRIVKRNNKTTGFVVQLRFIICINVVDISLLNLLRKSFGCGVITSIRPSGKVEFTISDIYSIINIVIPHFLKYPLRGTKYLDFCDWVSAAHIVYNKEHLTQEGINKIIHLKSGMNKSRIYPINYQPNHTITTNSSYIPLNGNYVSGFIAGDGCISIKPSHLLRKFF